MQEAMWPRVVCSTGTRVACAFLMLSLAYGTTLFAQLPISPRVVVNQWTVADGLPVNSINALVQTTDGYLWLATFDGLVRFDGTKFTSFDSTTNPELVSNRFTRLFRGGDDTLWLITEHYQLVRFRNRQFTTISQGGEWVSVTAASPARSGGVLVGYDNEVARIRDAELVPLTDSRIDGKVIAIHEGKGERVWAGTEGGRLYRIDRDGSLSLITDALPHWGIRSLLELDDETLLVGTRRGLHRLAQGNLQRTGPADLDVLAVERDSSGRIWIGTSDMLFRVEGAEWVPVRPLRDLTGAEPVLLDCLGGQLCLNTSYAVVMGNQVLFESSSAIKDLLSDREGNLWIATAADGLHVLRRTAIAVVGYDEGLKNRNAYPIVEGRDGSIWIGTANGLARLQSEAFLWWDSADGGLPLGSVWTILEDRGGNVWVGGDQGLCRFVSKRCERVLLPGKNGSPVVRALFEDPSGTIWIGTSVGIFLVRDQKLLPIRGDPTAGGSTARVFLQGTAGSLWIGTGGSGLLRFRDGALEKFTTSHGLSSNVVRSLYEDAQGKLWVGTEGRGLCRLDSPASKRPSITCIDASNGLYDDGIHQILGDDLGRLWMSTNRGVFRVSVAELDAVLDGRTSRVHSRAYTEKDGLPSREANGGVHSAGIRSSDGRLWFPTQGGVAVIDPGRAVAPAPAPVIFESIEARQTVLDPRGEIELARGARDVSIRYTAPWFGAPESLIFRHRLDAYDEEWIEARDERIARYTHLPPGRYELEVAARSIDGRWPSSGARLVIHIPPFFWETGWFRGLMILTVILLLGGLSFWRTRAIRRRGEQLEWEVAERTRDLEKQTEATKEALDTVRHQNVLLEQLSEARSRFFANVSHELRTPLTLILGPLEDSDLGGMNILDEQQRRGMLRSARRLRRLVDQMLDLQKIDAGKLVLDFRIVDLRTVVERTVEVFATFAERHGIELTSEIPEQPLGAAIDWEQFEKVLGNLVSNALKFTPSGGRVTLSLRRLDVAGESTGSTIELSVADTGPGIPDELQDRIFERFVTSGEMGARRGTGIGLALVREIVELHQGTVAVESEPEQGSRFTVRIPCATASSMVEVIEPPIPFGPGEEEGEEVPVTAHNGDRPRVLIVDDHQDIRAYVRRILQPRFDLIEAADGKGGLEAARRELPDVVVTDVMMPAIDGFALGRYLREDPATDSIPLIYLTARSAAEDEAEAFASGGDQYLRKPFTSALLLARVESIFQRRTVLRRRLHEEWLQAPRLVPVVPDEDSLLSRARVAILEQIHDDAELTVEWLAQAVNVSRSHLYRRLQDEAKTTPQAFIRKVRIERAAELLRKGAGSVTEVAVAVGFVSLAHFSRAFREELGVSPSQWR